MKTTLTIAAVLLGLVALVLIGVLRFFVWAVGTAAREEDRQIRQQIEDDRVTCGLIEED